MRPGSIVRERAEELAIEIVEYVDELRARTQQFAICDQLIRCGTSPGANLAESAAAESKKDLIHKIKLALKEARETEFWLNVIQKSGNANAEHHELVKSLNSEVISMLVVSLSTLNKT